MGLETGEEQEAKMKADTARNKGVCFNVTPLMLPGLTENDEEMVSL